MTRYIILILTGLAVSVTTRAQDPTYSFVNGRWFDGEEFVQKTFYSEKGSLKESPTADVDSVIDLKGQYVIPPFGEAHTHLLSHVEELDEQFRMFLQDGVFYAMNQDPIYSLTPKVLDRVRAQETVDVIYTRGVVTASWNIVAGLYKTFAEQGMFGEDKTLDDLDQHNLFLIDNQRALENKWDRLSEINPHFIKIVLAFSEEQEIRRQNSAYDYELGSYSQTPGIKPELLPELVERAHRDGLKTSVHIETAADFHLAVEAETDFVAHLPASWQVGEKAGFTDGSIHHWIIDEQDAENAAENNITVITTAIPPPDSVNRGTYREIHTANLSLLKAYEVPIILGSDLFDRTVLAEAIYLSGLDLFSNRELLKLVSHDTPRAIFPERKIGRLKDGYEASFLVLDKNPLNKFDHIRTITLIVKEGNILKVTQ